MKGRRNRKSFLLKLAVVAFAVYISGTLIYQTIQIRQSNDQLARLKAQLAEQEEENAQTQRILSEDDEQFMESVARQELGYAKPSERIYVDTSGN